MLSARDDDDDHYKFQSIVPSGFLYMSVITFLEYRDGPFIQSLIVFILLFMLIGYFVNFFKFCSVHLNLTCKFDVK